MRKVIVQKSLLSLPYWNLLRNLESDCSGTGLRINREKCDLEKVTRMARTRRRERLGGRQPVAAISSGIALKNSAVKQIGQHSARGRGGSSRKAKIRRIGEKRGSPLKGKGS